MSSTTASNQQQEELLTELCHAISAVELEEVKAVLKKGADVNGLRDEDDGGMTPLMEAVMLPETNEIAKYLVKEAKADINKLNRDEDMCALAMAISNENSEATRFLIENGAKLTLGAFDATIAASIQPETLKYVLSKGGNANAREPMFGKTPALMAVLAAPEVESIKLLLAAGADFFTTDKLGKNIFHLAASNSENGARNIKFLVEAGAFDSEENKKKVESLINARDTSAMGFTPLHEAVSASNADVVELLVNNFKADKSIKSLACEGTENKELTCADILEEVQQSFEEDDEDDEEGMEDALADVKKCRELLGITSAK